MKEELEKKKSDNSNNKSKTKFSRIIIIIISTLLLITVIFFYDYLDQTIFCKSDWKCGEWSICKAGVQSRVCADQKNCNNPTDKPIENQQCLCVGNWSCTEWSNCSRMGKQNRTCVDENVCENTTGNPADLQSCIPPDSSEYILQLADFPQGWVLKERVERFKSDIDAEALYWGWKGGYKVSYVLMFEGLEKSWVEQYISIYPLETVSFPMEKEIDGILKTAFNENISSSYIGIQIGNSSVIYRTKSTIFGIDYTSYTISFSKFDVFEKITIYGSIMDVELLKELATKAADKIV